MSSEDPHTDRIELLREAAAGASPEYLQNVTEMEQQEGADSATVETTVLFSWVDSLVQPAHDNSWLERRLAAITYRGGPRSPEDEAYQQLNLSETQLNALTTIIREKQLEVANGFFGIHSGAYSFKFDPMPGLRFTLHYGEGNEDLEVSEWKELPNAIDDLFFSYTTAPTRA